MQPTWQDEERGYEMKGSRPLGQRWAWLIIIVLCAAIVGWGLVNYKLISDAPRQWDFGLLPQVPGQSIYSSSQPAEDQSRRQIENGPFTRPAEPAKTQGAPR